MMIKKLFTGVVLIILILTVLLSGCTDVDYETFMLQGSGTTMTITASRYPLNVDVLGSENQITFGKDVTVNVLRFPRGASNNTVYLVAGLEAHNATVNDNGQGNNVIYS